MTMILTTLPLFSLLLSISGAAAEKHIPKAFDESVEPNHLSPGQFGTIHGSGSIDFARLHYDFGNNNNNNNNYILTAAMAIFPNKKEILKFQTWENQDTASSRMRRDEYLSQMGVGVVGNDGEYYVCCTPKAVEVQACNLDWNNTPWSDDEESMLNLTWTGNMILSAQTRVRVLEINETIQDGSKGDLGLNGLMWFGGTNQVGLFFANCNATESVRVHGNVVWTSYVTASTLPLYAFLAFCHAFVCLWYRERMNRNRDSRIQVEEWIFMALFLATVAIIVKTIYYGTEAFANDEYTNLSFAAEFSNSVARAVSRCLYLLLAMGVGVTAPRLESKQTTMLIGVFLGLYILCDLVADLTIYGIILPFIGYTFNMMLILSIIFMVWIPVSLKRTMRLLEFQNETHKLERYQWIWNIYLLAIALGVMQIFFVVLDVQLNAGRDYDWITQDEQNDVAYLIIITCMAVLWKPNPSQQMYSYQLLGDDGDAETPTNMSLELSEQPPFDDNSDLQLAGTSTL